MSRSYTVLVASLVGVAGLVGLAQAITSDDDPVAIAEASTNSVVDATVPEATTTTSSTEVVPEIAVDPDCTVSSRLEVGTAGPEVACLESRLIAAGALSGVTPDEVFDTATGAAVEAFQSANGLVVDGMVGPQTATVLGVWSGPAVLPADPDTCADDGRSAVVDRFNQRAWLCDGGVITVEMPITSAISQPDPGDYEVYAKDLNASSTLTGQYSTMTHFVAFTYGKYQGARIAFHSVPMYPNGEYVQPLDSVGTQELFGDSSGCIRVLPDDAVRIWDFLDVGDTVTVIT